MWLPGILALKNILCLLIQMLRVEVQLLAQFEIHGWPNVVAPKRHSDSDIIIQILTSHRLFESVAKSCMQKQPQSSTSREESSEPAATIAT